MKKFLLDFVAPIWRSKPLKPVRLFTERLIGVVKNVAAGRFHREPVVLLGIAGALVTSLKPIILDQSVPWWHRIVLAAPAALAIIASQFTYPKAVVEGQDRHGDEGVV